MASITKISDVDSEPFFIAIFASLCLLHYNTGNMFISMALCFAYYCLRILSMVGEDNTFRLVRSCLFYGIGFVYIFFYTRTYLKRERENFMKHHN